MSFEAASPALTQRLLDLLNDRITPVVQSRGTVGEGDLGPFTNVGATMVGAGNAYYQGVRMSAAEALKQAGLSPLVAFGADDSELESTNAYATGQVALLLYDAREALSWADLTYAIDLNGMNSSVSPLSLPVQQNGPFKWLNWDAARVLDMLKGSYLFELDDRRIIQDPESLRASSIRQGSAWQAWAQLRDVATLQMNSSDHNPAVRVGMSPSDSWELSTPQLAQFYVKGSARNHFQHGYIVSNANWDPYPMANEIEAFTIALANMDTAVAQRMLRFTNKFFTIIVATDESPGEPGRFHLTEGSEIDATALMQEIQGLINPVPPEGNALIQTVEDLQTQTRLKVTRSRQVVADTIDLLAEDLLTGTYWLDLPPNATTKPRLRSGANCSVEGIPRSLAGSRRGRGDGDAAHSRDLRRLHTNKSSPKFLRKRFHTAVIANARMYSVSSAAGDAWRGIVHGSSAARRRVPRLLGIPSARPRSLAYGSGLISPPCSCAAYRTRALSRNPHALAVPVPSPAEFRGLPQYWSEFIVKADSAFEKIEDTFEGRLAFTDPESQSGCAAAMHALMTTAHSFPLYGELIAPQITPPRRCHRSAIRRRRRSAGRRLCLAAVATIPQRYHHRPAQYWADSTHRHAPVGVFGGSEHQSFR